MGPLCARTSAASHWCQVMLWTAYPTIWKFGIRVYLDLLGAACPFLGWMGPLCARTSAASHWCQVMLWTAYPTIWKFGIRGYLDLRFDIVRVHRDCCIVRVKQVSIDVPTSPMCCLLGFTSYPIDMMPQFFSVFAWFWKCGSILGLDFIVDLLVNSIGGSIWLFLISLFFLHRRTFISGVTKGGFRLVVVIVFMG